MEVKSTRWHLIEQMKIDFSELKSKRMDVAYICRRLNAESFYINFYMKIYKVTMFIPGSTDYAFSILVDNE